MKVVFVSNFFNHHQRPFSNSMSSLCDYTFIETEPMDDERKGMGWSLQDFPEYVFPSQRFASEPERALQIITDADVVILGSAPDTLFVPRLKQGKITFRYSERLYKEGTPLHRLPHDIAGAWLHHGRFQKYPLYMLCASAYTATDVARFGNYRNRCFQWGYFPEAIQYPDETLSSRRHSPPIRLLWVARMLDWKHPEAVIEVADRLKRDGYDYHLDLIGSGPMQSELESMISEKHLEQQVHLLGTMPPEDVRSHMLAADIFLFTSDRYEGWGAVLNEAMNSGCAVVASHSIGSAPFLIENGKNGLLFRSGDWDDLYQKVKQFVESDTLRYSCGQAAYRTITEQWNAANAAERFFTLVNSLQRGDPTPFTDGPCSKANLLNDDWM